MAGGNKAVYEIITQKIIERLTQAKENGEVFKWVKGWDASFTGNAITGHHYRGINALFLDGQYITYKQLQDFSAKHKDVDFVLQKGTKQSTVYFYKFQEIEEEVSTEKGVEQVKKIIPIIKFYNVYNIEQIENLSPFFIKTYTHDLTSEMQEAEKVIMDFCNRTGLMLDVNKNGKRCYYSPKEHKVSVPDISHFASAYEYYSAVFHELVHSTGKALGRDMGKGFGTETYSFEELIAEIGSSMIMSRLNMERTNVFENSVAYIDGWLDCIKGQDIYFVSSAANKAQKACDLILNEMFNEKDLDNLESA